MKQTAVEFLVKETPNMYWEDSYWADLFERAKEMDKQQKDDFAIGFAEWISMRCYITSDDVYWLIRNEGDIKKNSKELLEIYKKEKGL